MSNTSIKRTQEQWLALFDEYERSSLTIQDFCLKNSLSASNFYAWKAKLRPGRLRASSRSTTPAQTMPFIEIIQPTNNTAKTSQSNWTVELELGNNMILRVRA